MVPEVNPNASTASKAAAMDEKSKQKLQKAVKEFESIFVNYLLQNMRKTVQQSEEKESNFGGEMMQGMFDLEIAKHISQRGSMGIGAMLYRQMTGEELPRTTSFTLPRTVSMPDRTFVTPPVKADTTRTSVAERLGQFEDIIKNASGEYDLNPNLIKAVIAVESAGNARAISSQKAKGLMQLIDSTATEMGVNDVWNPRENIYGGSRYLRQMMDRFGGNATLALASYNAGPGAVEKHGGIPPYSETRDYVKRVMKYFDLFEQQGVMSDEER
jgi:Rod binding domain-containing protein